MVTDCSGCGGPGGGPEKAIQGGGQDPAAVDPKRGVRLADPPCCVEIPQYNFVHAEDLVYGKDYIDEQVAQVDDNAVVNYVLQDANYNVVGLVGSSGVIRRQFTYHPYGNTLAVEDGTGQPVAEPESLLRFQGLWYDRESGSYYVRARYYNPAIMRWMQQDPNGAGLVLLDVETHQGQNAAPRPVLSHRGRYDDGVNLYEYVSSHRADARSRRSRSRIPEFEPRRRSEP